ncbi:MAG: hypothetical protein ACE5GC_06695 [Acidimicrobiia bacterium]
MKEAPDEERHRLVSPRTQITKAVCGMNPGRFTRIIVLGLVVVLLVGIVDAAIGGEWDLLGILAIALVLSLVLASRLESRRPLVPIRRDLFAWLEDRAAVSGEPVTVVADRAIASFTERYGHAMSPPQEPRE